MLSQIDHENLECGDLIQIFNEELCIFVKHEVNKNRKGFEYVDPTYKNPIIWKSNGCEVSKIVAKSNTICKDCLMISTCVKYLHITNCYKENNKP